MIGSIKLNKLSPCQSLKTFGMKMAKKKKKRTVVVGLESQNSSRDLLLRLLINFIEASDTIVAVHIPEPGDTLFDPNTFHIYEDICKSKQVDFYVKVCSRGASLSDILTDQARLHFATTLVLGCSRQWPKDSLVTSCLKGLPPTCTLVIMDKTGRIILKQAGTLQQGLTATTHALQHCFLSIPFSTSVKKSEYNHHFPKLSSTPSSSRSSSPMRCADEEELHDEKKSVQHHDSEEWFRQLQRLAVLEAKGVYRNFTPQELARATDNFSPLMVIGEGGRSKVYKANLADGQAVAVKLLKISQCSGEELLREIEMLSSLNHENIIELVGYSYSKKMKAIVYRLMKGSLKQNLGQLGWDERVKVAVGVAKALEYLHHACSPPIIHRDVKSSNILLSHHGHPQLSDFEAAMVHNQPQQLTMNGKSPHVVGTFGYLAPEYMMYGEVDVKTDVYSFGVVLLELITGKEAIQTNSASHHESLVLWARSLLSQRLCKRLIDPSLNGTYDREDMQRMMVTAQLCLIHSSPRRPTMKMILRSLEEPEYWIKVHRERRELVNGIGSEDESGLQRHEASADNSISIPEDHL